MAGYSGTPLERKLGIRPEHVVYLDGAPDDLALEAATTRRLPARVEVALTFHTRASRLQRRLPALVERLEPAGALWVCWPKKAAQKAQGIDSDLDDDVVRRTGLATGLVDVKVCAIDETWSGLKFVRRLADR